MKLQFFGAAKTVTGSRILLTHFGKRILVDCGLFQGPKEQRLLNWEPFIDPKTLDCVILTHAHIDHSGYLPKLVKEGFNGPIYCSQGTADLCRILLLDSAHLQEEDAGFANRTHYSHHVPALPLYEAKDAQRAIDLLHPLPRDKWNDLGGGMSFQFIRAGHIIGASYIRISYESEGKNRLITFSGDVGNNRSETLRGPDALPESDYLILESTYGDRIQPREDPTIQLGAIINKTMDRGGILVIPSFSVGRTQEILYLIRKLEESKRIKQFKVYVDSPLANHATEIYLAHPEDHRLVLREGTLTSPFWSSHYEAVRSPDDSMLLCMKDGPFIVLSAAGMLTGGRIMHHLEHRLGDAKNTVLFVGFQAEGTKGRLLQGGIADLRIHHKLIQVEAEIATMDSLSAHADANDLIELLSVLHRPPQKIIINHGELDSSLALAERIHTELGFTTIIPDHNQVIECP